MNKFKLTIIGSGGMMPTKNRHPSCYFLEIGDKKIILDIGHTSIARLVKHDIDLHSIDALFISHFHTDHFADAFPLIHSLWVDGAYLKRKNKSLTIIGPKSTEERWKKLRKVFWLEPTEKYPLKFIEGPQSISLGKIRIELFEVKHVKWFQSLGIKIHFNNKVFVYTGDIGSDHPLAQLQKVIENTDVLLIEAGHIKPTPNHLTINQIIEIAEKSNVKKIIATHIREENLPIFKKKIGNRKNIILAKDLMEVSI